MSEQRQGRSRIGMAVGAALIGLAAGIAASVGRKAALQAAEALTGDWTDLLKAEHLMLGEVFDLLETTRPEQKARRRRLMARLRTILDKHGFEEENALYPLMRLHAPDSGVEPFVAAHAEFKSLLFELDRTDPSDPRWSGLIATLQAKVEAHIREEEDVVFPHLKQTLSGEQSVELTNALLRSGSKLV